MWRMSGPQSDKNAIWPAVLLAAIAGFVDAFGYLVLSHLFVAHMSGNSAALGAFLGARHWHEAVLRAAPLPAFMAGVAAGALSVDLMPGTTRRRRLTPAFLLEIALLVAFYFACPPSLTIPARSPLFYALMSLLAAAMGVQAATLRRAGGERVTTTFVSGMLANMTEEMIASCLHRASSNGDPAMAAERAHGARMLAAIFIAFMVGAAGGSVAKESLGRFALAVPIFGLVGVILDDALTGGRRYSEIAASDWDR